MRVPPAIVMRSSGGRAACRSPTAASAARLLRALLERAQRLQVGIHAHERLDQTLRLLERPLDLLPADGLERAPKLLVEAEQVRYVAHARLGEPPAELAVIAPQLVGLTLDVGRHAEVRWGY